LESEGNRCAVIHGNRSQAQRERALEDFRRGKARILVATDVAARGIHIDDVPCVVHWDPPDDAKDYVHRSGRTGRAGARGVVVSLVDPSQKRSVVRDMRSIGIDVQWMTAQGAPRLRPGEVGWLGKR
jgi:superfamily II DNA/RNA helicase